MDSPRKSEFRDVVERALQRELTARRELRPHAQLAIPPNATPGAIQDAYARLRVRYDAAAFAEYGAGAVAAACSIIDLLVEAYVSMRHGEDGSEAAELISLPKLDPRPRRDETCRALETLRGAIQRRLSEAHAHRDAGRLQEAIRGYESVLVIDRRNELAQEALRELRAEMAPAPPTTLSRVLGRVLGRRFLAARTVEG